MLNVQSITRRYGELKAVDNVSFAVQTGEIVGLLGHNGAGKTTVMKMLSGYLEPDSGTIKFHDHLVSTHPQALQRELGYLPENPPIYPELSVAGYLDYAAELKGLKGDAKRQAIKYVIEATELGSKLLSPIATLSRGMKQRVGVCQAILGSPSLLILDEPTNGLDPTQTEQMRQVIRNISETATVILSTHIMQEVEALCDRALIIRQGKLAVDAKLDDLTSSNRITLQTPASLQVVSDAMAHLSWYLGISEGDKQDQYRLQLDNSADISERLIETAQCLVEKGIPIVGLTQDAQDLQSLFVQVNSVKPVDSDGSKESTEVEHVA